ncbi:hypothetical protein [Yoonia sp.]|uniref:hypothetical protein n=1 Tax=Yoonia sp. TaxID=2212373 RepID=UPI002E0692E3|nr:hypothetical protein [Yoonia sp.]
MKKALDCLVFFGKFLKVEFRPCLPNSFGESIRRGLVDRWENNLFVAKQIEGERRRKHPHLDRWFGDDFFEFDLGSHAPTSCNTTAF